MSPMIASRNGIPADVSMSTTTWSKMPTGKSPTYDVVVIGGGLSGLTAAYRLLCVNPELRVVVLEAKARLGGRTFTQEMKCLNGMDMWDLGGQWVSNSQTDIMALIAELGLDTYPQFVEGKKLMQVGGFEIKEYKGSIPNMSILSLLDFQWFIYKLENICKEIDVRDPFSYDRAAEFDNMTVETYTSMQLYTKAPKEVFDVAIRTTFGVDPGRMSMLFLLTYAAAAGGLMKLFETDNFGAQERKVKIMGRGMERFIPSKVVWDGATQMWFTFMGGISMILASLVKLIGEENIVLSSPVTHISQEMASEDNSNQCTAMVTTSIGVTYEAQRIIIAIPLHLGSNITFDPPLPEKRKLLISNMPMGHLSKFVVTYPKAFWREKGFSGEIVSNGGRKVTEDCDCGPISIVFDATNHNGNPALVGFFGGKYGTQWCSAPYEVRKTNVMKTLAQFFGQEALWPLDYCEKLWSEEAFNGGCPVNIGIPGTMEYVTNHLRTPLGRIHWAGTETATVWWGYLSGAVQAGKRAANEVIYHLQPHLLTTDDLKDMNHDVKLTKKTKRPQKAKSNCFFTIMISVAVFFMVYIFQRIQ